MDYAMAAHMQQEQNNTENIQIDDVLDRVFLYLLLDFVLQLLRFIFTPRPTGIVSATPCSPGEQPLSRRSW